jgi:2-polyprenyl-6-methoxyphenol hydroxylase-like FAD-dependent oxidoreductase
MTFQKSSTPQRALIVGGGIGGMAAAIALRQIGMDVQIFERAAEIREVGAGLLVWKNAFHALEELGLAEEVRALGVPNAGSAFRSWRGETLVGVDPHAMATRLVIVHRADLLAVLRAALPGPVITLGASVSSVTQDAAGVTLTLADGRSAHGEILIGADGLHSVVRANLFGQQPPRYAGYTSWRGVVPFDGTGLVACESFGRGARFGMAPLRGGRVYWYATQSAPAGTQPPEGGWKPMLLQQFRGWHAPIEALIAATDAAQILHLDIYDRPPLRHWSDGRITLLGDAAHPMTPNLGQGACQALEDAVALAQHLKAPTDPIAALQAYEAARIPRTTSIVRQARAIGAVGQWANPLACMLRDTLLKHVANCLQARQLKPLIGHQV